MSELTSLSRWILQAEQQYHRASGDFTLLLSHIAMATKVVSRNVAHAGLIDVLGKTGEKNTGGDDVAKMDVIANELLVSMLDDMPMVAGLASEEEERFRPTRAGRLNGRRSARSESRRMGFGPLRARSGCSAACCCPSCTRSPP